MKVKSMHSSHSMNRKENVAVIVVTHNRRQELLRCIQAILNQTMNCDIIIVDNASIDGTKEALHEMGIINHPCVHYLYRSENTGGAGGFYQGLKWAINGRWQWFWLMDDDALPERDALEKLLIQASNWKNIYGSTAVGADNGKIKLCFPARRSNQSGNEFIEYHESLANLEDVAWIPFLGFLIHRKLIENIGLPDKDFFILDDDVEYSVRAKKKGAKLKMVKSSIIYHPFQPSIPVKILNWKIYYRSMPAWKVYYDVRNKILIARRHYPILLWTKTMPGIIFRAIFALLHEKKKRQQIHAYSIAIIDGLFGRKGKRSLNQ